VLIEQIAHQAERLHVLRQLTGRVHIHRPMMWISEASPMELCVFRALLALQQCTTLTPQLRR
jgi:hypothetical protein